MRNSISILWQVRAQFLRLFAEVDAIPDPREGEDPLEWDLPSCAKTSHKLASVAEKVEAEGQLALEAERAEFETKLDRVRTRLDELLAAAKEPPPQVRVGPLRFCCQPES